MVIAGGDELELGHTVQRVDVIHPFHPVLIALMYAVDADIARHPVGLGGRLADGYAGCPPRRFYRWETEMPASRSKRASPNIWYARSISFLVAGPDKVLCRTSISANKATSMAVKRPVKPCLAVA